jgi:UDP-N-acetylmuramyl pentapeptide synthase
MTESNIYTFFDSQEAGHFLKDLLEPKDLVLVKGSQNRVRMERLVKIIMDKPDEASVLLCRQDKAWEKI